MAFCGAVASAKAHRRARSRLNTKVLMVTMFAELTIVTEVSSVWMYQFMADIVELHRG